MAYVRIELTMLDRICAAITLKIYNKVPEVFNSLK